MNNQAPIGIFDSGIGGLTVLKTLQQKLPHESFIYLGDTARVPYGSHAQETIKQFSFELLDFILKQNVKLVVVACNTIAATCLEELKQKSPVPIISVIEPTVEEVINVSQTKKIGVIGTRATIESNIYKKKFELLSADWRMKFQIYQQPCPLFVPIVEENLLEHLAAEKFARTYLEPLLKNNIDTLVLGCTHYPLMKDLIRKIVGESIQIVDSAEPTAEYVLKFLESNNLLSENPAQNIQLDFTEVSDNTKITLERFLGKNINSGINLVNLA